MLNIIIKQTEGQKIKKKIHENVTARKLYLVQFSFKTKHTIQFVCKYKVKRKF